MTRFITRSNSLQWQIKDFIQHLVGRNTWDWSFIASCDTNTLWHQSWGNSYCQKANKLRLLTFGAHVLLPGCFEMLCNSAFKWYSCEKGLVQVLEEIGTIFKKIIHWNFLAKGLFWLQNVWCAYLSIKCIYLSSLYVKPLVLKWIS